MEQGKTNVRMINRGPVRFRCLKPTWPPAFITRVIDGDTRKTHRSTWDPRDLIGRSRVFIFRSRSAPTPANFFSPHIQQPSDKGLKG